MTTPTQRTLLVTGASGHLGRRTVQLLLAAHRGDQIIAGSRDPQKLADLKAAGAEVRTVDFDQPHTLPAAFAGVDRLLIISTDSLDTPGKRAAQHTAAIAAAQAAGVKHIVYTSITNAVPSSVMAVAPDHVATEQALAESGVGYTSLRNNLYAENNLPAWKHALQDGQWFAAAGEGGVGYVTRDDCAAAAAGALASTFDGTRTLDITGPAVLTHAQVAKIVSEVAGRPLTYANVPVAAVVAGLKSVGLPEFLAEALATFDTATAQGELAVSTDAVNELSGRPATALRDFLTANRSALLG
jgi:NAD(P)H dehydrogenase (quinone)